MSRKISIGILLVFADIAAMYLTLSLGLYLRYKNIISLPAQQLEGIFFHFSFIYLFWVFILYLLDFYQISFFKKTLILINRFTLFFILANGIGITYFYLLSRSILSPKTILLLNSSFFVCLSFLLRYGFNIFNKSKEKIACIGFDKELEDHLNKILVQSNFEISVILRLESHGDPLLRYCQPNQPFYTSQFSKFNNIIQNEKIETILLTPNNKKINKVILHLLPSSKLNYLNFPSFYEELTKKIPIDFIDETWLLENISNKKNKLDSLIKIIFDVTFSMLGYSLCLFLFPIIAVIIKIDSKGPILYKQKRLGKNGRTFTIYKFRTMKMNAEIEGPQWAKVNDERITRIGKLLRNLYLDELPQFYNVLKGDCSIVGPRPERPEFVAQLKEQIPFYEIRQCVKPGLTGWAQINFHSSATVEEAKEKFQYDLYYLKRRSLILDLSILLKTITVIFFKN